MADGSVRLLRLPLYPAERDAAPTTVCVTGGTGYIAASIIERLLAAGHTVHATVRKPSGTARLSHLLALPGAGTRLQFFKANLEAPGSFDAAVEGCSCVFHTASPVVMDVPRGQGRERLIVPAVSGVENVLASVNRAPSIRRVVLTSSVDTLAVAAVVASHGERGPGHLFSERDWSLGATEDCLPYYASKRLAEERAGALQRGQARWDLVSIQPAVVQGPPLGNMKCESVGLMRKLLRGAYWPAVPMIGMGIVDVDDVAAAHTLAMVTPAANGRYICVGESVSLLGYGRMMRESQPEAKLPITEMGWWWWWLLNKVIGKPELDLIRATWGPPPHFDTSKAQKELGMTFLGAQKCGEDMAKSLKGFGIV